MDGAWRHSLRPTRDILAQKMWRFAVLAPVALIFAQAAPRIPPIRPEVQGVFPHGGQRGTDVDLTIRGRNFENASEIRFASPDLTARILEVTHNSIHARFHLDPSAELGRHDFRIVAPQGSNIGWFDVGSRVESMEVEPNNDREHAQPIQFPVVMNGLIQSGDYDYFKFTARAGQTITFDVNATRNGSPLDSVLSLLDQNGVEIEYSDDYYIFKDPHIVHTFAKAGTYYLRIYGSGESGSDNSDYRLTAGEMPHVDFAMPSGGRRGTQVEFQLVGVNLSAVKDVVLGAGLAKGEVIARSSQSATVRMKLGEELPPGVFRLHVTDATLPVPFVVSDYGEITVRGETARRKHDPVPLDLPVVANGVLDKPRAADYFSFRVDAPQTVALTVDSMQLGFPLDPMIAIYDESCKRIAWQDDPTTNTGKEPSNLDPHLVFHLPSAGRYTAMVRDSAYRGDPTFAYRFTIKRAEPHFTVKVIGTDETLFRGKENIVTLRVRRLEGWDAPVRIWAENLPAGVSAREATAEPKNTPYKGTCGEDHFLDGTNVEIPLTVSADALVALSQIRFRARGMMNGKTVEREAHTRYWWKTLQKVRGDSETAALCATIADPPQLILTTPDKLAVAPGKSGNIKVVIARFDETKAPLDLASAAPVDGLTIEPLTVPAGATIAQVTVTNRNATPTLVSLTGRSEGRLLGKSNPILIDPKENPMPEAPADEN